MALQVDFVCSGCYEPLSKYDVTVLSGKVTFQLIPCSCSKTKMPDPEKYERSMNGLRKLVCEPKMGGEGTLRGEGWDAASRKAWHFFDRHLHRKQS